MIALRGLEPVCISWNDNAANSRANSPISSIDRTLRNDRGFVCAMADGSAEVEQTQSLGHCGVVNLGRRSDQPLICKPFLLHRSFKVSHRGSVNPTPSGGGTSLKKTGAARLAVRC